jgi:hypothetical protein
MPANSDSSSDPTESRGSTAAGAHAASVGGPAGASATTNRIVAPDRDATTAITVDRDPAPAGPVDRDSTNAIPVDRDSTNAIPVDRSAGADHTAPAERTNALPLADPGADSTQAITGRPAAGLTADTAPRHPVTDPTPTAGHSTLPAMAAPAAAAVPAAAPVGAATVADTGRHHRPDPADVPVAPAAQPSRQQVVAAQKERFGGLSWGAAFFGWLSANGMAVLLIALLSAGGLVFGLSDRLASVDQAAESAASGIGLGAGIALLVVLFLAYLAGGYVAGRMTRFNGARQGVAVWVIGLVVVVLLALAGLLFGAQYNVLSQLDLPRIPVDEGTATTAGVIALVAVLLGTLIGAVLGGLLGTRYHRKVDRVGFDS